MGRKRKEHDLVTLNASGVYDYWVWNEKRGRHDPKSTSCTDKEAARTFALRQLEHDKWKTLQGADLTFSAGYKFWQNGKPNFLSWPAKLERLSHVAHILGDLKIGDTKTPDIVDGIIKDMLNGVPVRRFPKAHSNRHRKLIKHKMNPNSVRLYVQDWNAMINYVSSTKENGKLIFPRQLVPFFTMPDKAEGPSAYKAADLFFEEEQVAEIFDACEKQMRSRGETRLSIEYRAVAMFLYGGGQRTSRVGHLPWANIDFMAAAPAIDFNDIPGFRYTARKKAKGKMPIPPDFLPILQRCWDERLSGDAGRWYFDAPISRHKIRKRLKEIYTLALGIEYGGGHALRKTFINQGIDAGQKDHLADLVGVSTKTIDAAYAKHSPKRDRKAINQIATWKPRPLPGEPATATVVPLHRKAKRRG